MSCSRRSRRANEEAIRKRRWGMGKPVLSCERQGARRTITWLDQSVPALLSPWSGCVQLTWVAGGNAAEQRLEVFCIAQVRLPQVCAEQVRPAQFGPKQARIAQVGLAQIRIT